MTLRWSEGDSNRRSHLPTESHFSEEKKRPGGRLGLSPKDLSLCRTDGSNPALSTGECSELRFCSPTFAALFDAGQSVPQRQ